MVNPYIPKRDFLTKTGQSDITILSEYVDIKYWKELLNAIKAFLTKIRHTNQSEILLIVGEWGKGKSSLLEYIRRMVSKNIVVVVLKVPSDIINEFSRMHTGGKLQIQAVIASLLKVALKEENILECSMDLDSLLDTFRRIYGDFQAVIFCIDQFEDIIIRLAHEDDVIRNFLEGLWNYTNESKEYQQRYGVVFHFVLAVTPEAFERYKQFQKERIGKYIRRPTETIYLRELHRNEAHEFLYGYLKYLYEDSEVLSKLSLDLPFIFDAIYLAGRGIPGYMQNILENFISKLISAYEKQKIRIKCELIEILADALKAAVFIEAGNRLELFDKDWYEQRLNYLRSILSSKKDNSEIERILEIYALLMLSPFGISEEEMKKLYDESYLALLDNVYSTLKQLNFKIFRYTIVPLCDDILRDLSSILSSKNIDKPEKFISELLSFLRRGFTKHFNYIIVPSDEESLNELILVLSRKGEYISQIMDVIKETLEYLMHKYRGKTYAYKLADDFYELLYPGICPLIPIIKDRSYAIKLWKETSKEIINAAVNPIDLGHASLQLIFYGDIISKEEQYKDDLIKNAYLKRKVNLADTTYNIPFATLAILNEDELNRDIFINKYKDFVYALPIIIVFTKTELKNKVENLAQTLRDTVMIIPITLSTKEFILLYALKQAIKQSKAIDWNEYMDRINNIRKIAMSPIKIDDEFWHKIILNAYNKYSNTIIKPLDRNRESALELYDIFIAYPEKVIDSEKAFDYIVRKLRRLSIHRKETIAKGRKDLEDVGREERKSLIKTLCSEELLTEISTEKYVIRMSPLEKRIVSLIDMHGGKIKLKLLLKAFISPENRAEESLSKYIQYTLERKGYVIFDSGDTLRSISLSELEKEIDNAIKSLASFKQSKEFLTPNIRATQIFHILASTKKEPRFSLFSSLEGEINRLKLRYDNLKEDDDKRRIARTILRLYEMFKNNRVFYERGYAEMKRLKSKLKSEIESLLDKLEKVRTYVKSLLPSFAELEVYEKLKQLESYLYDAKFYETIGDLLKDISSIYYSVENGYYNKKGRRITDDFSRVLKDKIKKRVPNFIASMININLYEHFSANNIATPEKSYNFNVAYFILKTISNYLERVIKPSVEKIFNKCKRIERILRSYQLEDIRAFVEQVHNYILNRISKLFNLSTDNIKISAIDISNLSADLQQSDLDLILEKIDDIVNDYNSLKELLQSRRSLSNMGTFYLKEVNNLIQEVNRLLNIIDKKNVYASGSEKELLKDFGAKLQEWKKEYEELQKELTRGITIASLRSKLNKVVRRYIEIKNLKRGYINELISGPRSLNEKYYDLRKKIEVNVNTIKDLISNLEKFRPSMSQEDTQILDNVKETLETEISMAIQRDINLVLVKSRLDDLIQKLKELENKYMNPLDMLINDSARLLLEKWNEIYLSDLIWHVKNRLMSKGKGEEYTQEEIERRVIDIILGKWKKRKIRLKISAY